MEHQAIAALSTRGRHVVARVGGHWVHLDQPDLVVEAIREVVEIVRGSPTASLETARTLP
jgi:pimeloyl-ACP methyl ester carboxylesterase